ncbi:hypothetical protein FQN51_006297 [Onygenales sp. PD_10]|nr:hypothetical protein FQN51_006297 [Onygenales sp. PD_10]
MFRRGLQRWVPQHSSSLFHNKLLAALPDRAARTLLSECPRDFHSYGARFFHPSVLSRSVRPLQARGPVRADDHEPPLDDEQLKELFSGYFPTDYPKDTIHLKTSFPEYLRLQQAFDTSKNKLMRKRVHVMYNESFHATAVRFRASPLHDCIVDQTQQEIIQRLLQEGKSGQFRISVDRDTFNNECREGEFPRAADLALRYKNASTGHSENVLIQEVGLTESYPELVDSICAWFRRLSSLQLAILVKIDETPIYKNPLLRKSVLDDPNLNLPNPVKVTLADVRLHDPVDPYGPLEVLGFRWVGEIVAFMEIWTRDPQTGKPAMRGQRIQFYGRGHSDQSPPLAFSDFVPPEETFKDPNFTFDWVAFREAIDEAKHLFAIKRCAEGVSVYRKKSATSPILLIISYILPITIALPFFQSTNNLCRTSPAITHVEPEELVQIDDNRVAPSYWSNDVSLPSPDTDSGETPGYIPSPAPPALLVEDNLPIIPWAAHNAAKLSALNPKMTGLYYRHRIANSTTYPWNAIGRVIYNRYKGDAGGWCTGALVGRNLLLTASHCFPWGYGKARWMTFAPGYRNGSEPYGSSYVSQCRGVKNIYNVTGIDYIICRLCEPLGDLTGWMGTKWWRDREPYMNRTWRSSGYPADAFVGDEQMLLSNISLINVDYHGELGRELETNLFAVNGWSGGPMWEYIDGEPTIVGVCSGAERRCSERVAGCDGELEEPYTVSAGGKLMGQLVAYGLMYWGGEEFMG